MTAAATQSDDRPLTGRVVLFYLLVAFGLITTVNLVMVAAALGTFTGETQQKSFAMGLDFNRTLDSVAQQHARNWTVDGELESAAGQPARLVMTYRDATGRPLDYLAVSARFGRPTTQDHDFELVLRPQGGGLYLAEVALPLAGRWNVRVSASDGVLAPYLLDYRFVAK